MKHDFGNYYLSEGTSIGPVRNQHQQYNFYLSLTLEPPPAVLAATHLTAQLAAGYAPSFRRVLAMPGRLQWQQQQPALVSLALQALSGSVVRYHRRLARRQWQLVRKLHPYAPVPLATSFQHLYTALSILEYADPVYTLTDASTLYDQPYLLQLHRVASCPAAASALDPLPQYMRRYLQLCARIDLLLEGFVPHCPPAVAAQLFELWRV